MKSLRMNKLVVAACAVATVGALAACSNDEVSRTSVSGAGPVTLAATGTATPTAATASPVATATGGATDDDSDQLAARAGLSDRRVVDAAAEIDVDDQSGDGRSVRLREASVSRGSGHVGIFTPAGRLLGSARVTPAVSPTSVRLDVAVPGSGELIAVLFLDDGDGVFDATKDVPLNDGGSAADQSELEDEDFDYRLR